MGSPEGEIFSASVMAMFWVRVQDRWWNSYGVWRMASRDTGRPWTVASHIERRVTTATNRSKQGATYDQHSSNIGLRMGRRRGDHTRGDTRCAIEAADDVHGHHGAQERRRRCA